MCHHMSWNDHRAQGRMIFMSIQVKVAPAKLTTIVIKKKNKKGLFDDTCPRQRVSENEYIIATCHPTDRDHTNKLNNLLRLQANNYPPSVRLMIIHSSISLRLLQKITINACSNRLRNQDQAKSYYSSFNLVEFTKITFSVKRFLPGALHRKI